MATNYPLSSSVEVFPSGFRDSTYATSRLTTEKNLTSFNMVSLDPTLKNYFTKISDTDDTYNKYLLGIAGYQFILTVESTGDLPQGSFAYISLSNSDRLSNIENSESLLDVENSFQGLGFTDNLPNGIPDNLYIKIREGNELKYSKIRLLTDEVGNVVEGENLASISELFKTHTFTSENVKTKALILDNLSDATTESVVPVLNNVGKIEKSTLNFNPQQPQRLIIGGNFIELGNSIRIVKSSEDANASTEIKFAPFSSSIICNPNTKTTLPNDAELSSTPKVHAQKDGENIWIDVTSSTGAGNANKILMTNNAGRIDGIVSDAINSASSNSVSTSAEQETGTMGEVYIPLMPTNSIGKLYYNPNVKLSSDRNKLYLGTTQRKASIDLSQKGEISIRQTTDSNTSEIKIKSTVSGKGTTIIGPSESSITLPADSNSSNVALVSLSAGRPSWKQFSNVFTPNALVAFDSNGNLPAATSSNIGGIRLGYSNQSSTRRAVKIDASYKAYVELPEGSGGSSYVLPKASNTELGGIKTNWVSNEVTDQYKVSVDSEGNAYASVPLSTKLANYQISSAQENRVGGVKAVAATPSNTIDYNTSDTNVGLKIDPNTSKAYVSVLTATESRLGGIRVKVPSQSPSQLDFIVTSKGLNQRIAATNNGTAYVPLPLALSKNNPGMIRILGNNPSGDVRYVQTDSNGVAYVTNDENLKNDIQTEIQNIKQQLKDLTSAIVGIYTLTRPLGVYTIKFDNFINNTIKKYPYDNEYRL